MSPRATAICIALFAWSLSSGSLGALDAMQQSDLTYERFMQLSVKERFNRFTLLSPDEQAALKQMHAQRWLEANRASLSQRQIELVVEAMSLFSADRFRAAQSIPRQLPYGKPWDSQATEREDELLRRLECELGKDAVTAAFTFLEVPRQRSWIDLGHEWVAWFRNCALGGGVVQP